MAKKLKAVGYVRVSTREQARKGESLDTQRKQIRAYSRAKGWNLVETYSDEGLSGAGIEYRVAFQQMLKDAESNKFDIIVFTKLSRFARNAREFMNLSHELENHGVMLASITEAIDPTTKTGKLIAGILALFAQWEKETIQEQMSENKMERWKDGRTFLGRVPFGYAWSKELNKLVTNTDEAKIYERLITMYLDQHLPFRDIAIRLNAEGVPTYMRVNLDGSKPKASRWTGATIRYRLKNPAYYGHLIVNQFKYEDTKRGVGTKRTDEMKPDSDHINIHPPALITRERWDAIQEHIQFNKKKSKRNDKAKAYFLRDVLVCEDCGSKVKPRSGPTRKDGTHPRNYACYWSRASKKELEAAGKHKCGLPLIPAESLEDMVWFKFMEGSIFNPEKAFKELLDPKTHDARIDGLDATLFQLNASLREERTVQKNLDALLRLPDADISNLNARLNQNRAEILSLEKKLGDTQAHITEIESVRSREAEIRKGLLQSKKHLSRIRQDIRKLGPEDRKILVEAMLQGNIVVGYESPYFDPDGGGPGGIGPGGSSGGPTIELTHRWNIEILQRFADEGKIRILDKNSSDYLSLIGTLSQ